MTNNLMMDFSIDKTNKRITVQKEFAAPVAKVWPAWTESQLLEQWWAPLPWKARTGKMDFREGGHWLYAMMGPEGEEHWARADYTTILPHRQFSGIDAFCDADGNINPDIPASRWTVSFDETDGTTLVTVVLDFDDLAALETMIQMGFREGFLSALGNLDVLLEQK